jgi:hypothetical protein
MELYMYYLSSKSQTEICTYVFLGYKVTIETISNQLESKTTRDLCINKKIPYYPRMGICF